MFGGFKAISANFTPAPNQFFDEVLGHYPCRVVTVVGILIRSTLGWEDPDTGDRRIEAELPLMSFIRPDLCESSARKGLAEAIEAGLIVRTAAANNRDGARYALRWSDEAALKRAIAKSRRTHGTEPADQSAEGIRGLKSTPPDESSRGVDSGGLKNTPPYIDKTKNPNLEKKRNTKQTLNVGTHFNFLEGKEPPEKPNAGSTQTSLKSRYALGLDRAIMGLVAELQDVGSERRHRQLLEICQNHGLEDLSRQALLATRRRRSQEGKHGVLENPGAYYQRILLKKLEEHQIFVPKSGEDDADEVRRMARTSMGLDSI